MRRGRGVALVALVVLAVAALGFLIATMGGVREGGGDKLARRDGRTQGAGPERPGERGARDEDARPAGKSKDGDAARADGAEAREGGDAPGAQRGGGGAGDQAAGSLDAAPRRELTDAEILEKIKAGEPGFEVFASRLQLGTQPIRPRWESGDVFVVETYRLQMQATPAAWTGPAVWRFEIAREVSFRDRPCYEFVVTRADDSAVQPTIYYVTRDGYRLAGMETTVTQQGKSERLTYVPEEGEDPRAPQAVKAPFSIVPFDLPPVGAEARVAPPGLWKDLPEVEERGMGRMPSPDRMVGAGREYLDVTYTSPIDGTEVRQRWSAADMRWPVVSRTATTLSFRLGE